MEKKLTFLDLFSEDPETREAVLERLKANPKTYELAKAISEGF